LRNIWADTYYLKRNDILICKKEMCPIYKKKYFIELVLRVFARPFAAAANNVDLSGFALTGCVSKVATPVRIARPMRSATTTDVKV
jgi:hypothetical protein